jgi:hypothetical protein
MNRLYSLLILALTGLIVMLEPDIADEPDAVLCDAGNEAAPPLSDAPLPDAFQRWMDGRHD